MIWQSDLSNPVLLASEDYPFPNPENSDKQGLLAYGGDLSPPRLLAAYRQGIFPWFEPGRPILWWSPNPRLLLFPHDFKMTRSLQQRLKQAYRITIDENFSDVIRACASVDTRSGNTWITGDMEQAYSELHQLGFAHSLEVWHEDELVGGLYGISLGRAFFGESMFHYERDASKIALYALCQTLIEWDFDFIDCQLPTAHLQRLGAKIVSRPEFLHRLKQTLEFPSRIGKWQKQN